MIEPDGTALSVRRQCELVGMGRSSSSYEPAKETPENRALTRQIDELYLAWLFMGSRQLAGQLGVNRKRVQRRMRRMGLEAVYPKPRTTVRGQGHKIYPYLLRNVEIVRVNQVWSSDITYVPLQSGFMYLTVVLERFFWSLKHEWTNHEPFATLEDARLSVFRSIETFCNPVRLHETLDCLSPDTHEAEHAPVVAA